MGEENPYAGPSSDVSRGRRAPSAAGISIRGVLVGLPIAVLSMLGAGLIFGLITTATVDIDLEEAARRGGGPVALASQIPYARVASLLVWAVGVLCGGYVAGGYSSDRQLSQGLLVGAIVCTFLVFIRLVSGNAGFAAHDVLVVSFVLAGGLGGALRGWKMARSIATSSR